MKNFGGIKLGKREISKDIFKIPTITINISLSQGVSHISSQ